MTYDVFHVERFLNHCIGQSDHRTEYESIFYHIAFLFGLTYKNILDLQRKCHQSLFPWNPIQLLSSATREKDPNEIQHTPSPTVTKFQGLVRSAGLSCSGQQGSTT